MTPRSFRTVRIAWKQTASEFELKDTAPVLVVYREDQTSAVFNLDQSSGEPRSIAAARKCFIAPGTERFYFKLSPRTPAFENREYAMRIVETTLLANWFFVGDDYSSYTLIRNTTNTRIENLIVTWRDAAGGAIYSEGRALGANGMWAVNARTIQPSVRDARTGVIEISHSGPPDSIVGFLLTITATT